MFLGRARDRSATVWLISLLRTLLFRGARSNLPHTNAVLFSVRRKLPRTPYEEETPGNDLQCCRLPKGSILTNSAPDSIACAQSLLRLGKLTFSSQLTCSELPAFLHNHMSERRQVLLKATKILAV